MTVAATLPEGGATTAACHYCLVTPSGTSAARKTLFKVVPVRLVAGEKSFVTFAFLDPSRRRPYQTRFRRIKNKIAGEDLRRNCLGSRHKRRQFCNINTQRKK